MGGLCRLHAHEACAARGPVPLCASPGGETTEVDGHICGSQSKAEHGEWPHSCPVYSHPFLGSHAQKLGCFVLALWLSGWHLPLAAPGFCLPEGNPDRGSTTGGGRGLLYLSNLPSRLARGSTAFLPNRPPPGPPNITIMSSNLFPLKKGRGQKGSWLRGG